MRKTFLILLMLAGVCYGAGPEPINIPRRLTDTAIPPIGIDQIKPGNSLMVSPGNYGTFSTLQEAYDWLASSDRDAEMGALSATARRTLILAAGTYTETIAADTDYVDVLELTPGTVRLTGGIGGSGNKKILGRSVKFAALDVLAGYEPIGLDTVNNVLYFVDQTFKNRVYRTTGNDLQSFELLGIFTDDSVDTVNCVFVTSSDSILVFGDDGTNGYLYRSADDGVTWAKVLSGVSLSTTKRSFCQTTDGDIFYGQYTTAEGTYVLSIYRSADDGATWAAVKTWNPAGGAAVNAVRHLHFVRADPYIANRVWYGTGDTNNQCAIGYTDNDFTDVTIIGSGSQQYRSVDLLFTATHVIWGMDSPGSEQYVYRYDRSTAAVEVISPDAGNSLYYGAIDSSGLMMYGSVFETGVHQLYTGSNLLTGDAASGWLIPTSYVEARYNATRLFCTPYGPDSEDNIYVGYSEVVGGYYYGRIVMGKLVNQAYAEPVNIIDAARKQSPYYCIACDPRWMDTSISYTISTANRIFFQLFTPPHDIYVARVGIEVTSAAGNIAVAIYDSSGSGSKLGTPANLLATTGSQALSTTGAIVYTLEKPVFLKGGVNYFVGIESDTTTAAILGDTTVLLASFGLARYIDTTFPPPATVGASTGTTMFWGCILFGPP